MSDRLKLSFIEFLNALPLGWGFMRGGQRGLFELVFDVPSECARHLQSGEVDIGLIPVIEYQRISNLRVIPGISIASRKSVRSVLFISRKPIQEVTSVAVDSASRTSTALLRILLSRFHERHEVVFRESHADASEMLANSDAALLIGNAALKLSGHGCMTYDLAAEWNRHTGLPFVFAFWAVRESVDLSDRIEAFYRSREEGLSAIDRIADIYSTKLALSPGQIRSYLRRNLDYQLGDPQLAGLRLFYDYAEELGLISEHRRLHFC